MPALLGKPGSDRRLSFVLGLALIACCNRTAVADTANDHFLLGYATAVLEQQFNLQAGSLLVKDGVISVQAKDLKEVDRDKVEKALKEIRGITRVEIINGANGGPPQPSLRHEASAAAELGKTKPKGGELLPSGRLFEPLIADPRWPHFSAGYQHNVGGDSFGDVAAISLGSSIGIYENDFPGGGRWQAGIDAAVFAIFDLEASSTDLINADYWLGFPFSYRLKDFSTILRLYHQSSHLGDEFLLNNRGTREALSYEGVDLRLSYDLFGKVLRVYGGGGYIFHKNPSDLEPWSVQGGIEIRSPRTFFGEHVRPIAGFDVQSREESDWSIDSSARVGLQFESERLRDRYLQLMVEYYRGHSPNGQFFDDAIEYWGLGLHFYY